MSFKSELKVIGSQHNVQGYSYVLKREADPAFKAAAVFSELPSLTMFFLLSEQDLAMGNSTLFVSRV